MGEPRKVWIVRATEDDYEPDVVIIGVFSTEEAAHAFGAVQPRRVKRFAGQPWSIQQSYDYEIEEVALDPAPEPWAQEVV